MEDKFILHEKLSSHHTRWNAMEKHYTIEFQNITNNFYRHFKLYIRTDGNGR